MRYEIGFSEPGLKKIDDFFAKYFKCNLVTSKKDKSRFYAHVFFKVIGSETRHYELVSNESNTGWPVTLYLSEEDFDYRRDNELR